MRLITNRRAVDSIEAYDRLMRRLDTRRGITNEFTHDFTEALNKAVSGTDLVKSLYDSVFYKKRITQKAVIKLNPIYRNELINESISLRLRAISDTSANDYIKTNALALIKYLKNEYHLENE